MGHRSAQNILRKTLRSPVKYTPPDPLGQVGTSGHDGVASAENPPIEAPDPNPEEETAEGYEHGVDDV